MDWGNVTTEDLIDVLREVGRRRCYNDGRDVARRACCYNDKIWQAYRSRSRPFHLPSHFLSSLASSPVLDRPRNPGEREFSPLPDPIEHHRRCLPSSLEEDLLQVLGLRPDLHRRSPQEDPQRPPTRAVATATPSEKPLTTVSDFKDMQQGSEDIYGFR